MLILCEAVQNDLPSYNLVVLGFIMNPLNHLEVNFTGSHRSITCSALCLVSNALLGIHKNSLGV